MSTADKLAQLLAPIQGDQIAGQDLTYSPLFDQIREARRADDPTLSQGDWGQSLKTADWNKVIQLCEQGLSQHSKDLQLAVWYGEAQVKTRGFAGAQLALQLLEGMIDQYWETCYPEFDAHDLDERVGKIEWCNNQLGMALREVPLTDPNHGGYHWHHWQESRDVENLGLKDNQAKEAALAEGKLSGDAFSKSVNASGATWFTQLQQQLISAQDAYHAFDRRTEQRFGAAAPGLAEMRSAINACLEVVNRLRLQWGDAPTLNSVPNAAPTSAAVPSAPASAPAMSAIPPAARSGPIQSRQDAVRQLNEVARYFRQHEPHSPVALLAERAAKWAEMSLEEWLGSVIKDDTTLGQLNELLDIQRN